MRLFIVLVLGLLLGAVIFVFAKTDANMIYLSGFGYQVNMPFLVFLPGLIITLLALYLLGSYLLALVRAPRTIKKWNQGRCEEKAQTYTMKGFAGLIEGNWEQAENDLLTKLQYNNSSLINYLGLAYSAQQRSMTTRRDLYIEEALRRFPKQKNAIDLTHARLHYQCGELEQAQQKLEKLIEDAPKNKAALRLLTDVFEKTENYEGLMQLLPQVKKLKALQAAELEHKEQIAYQNVLANPALSVDQQGDVNDSWKALPRQAKKNVNAVYAHAQSLIAEGNSVEAEKLVRKALNRQYDSQLALFYAQIETKLPKDQLKQIESWLRKTPESDELKLGQAKLNRRLDNVDYAQQLLRELIASESYLRTEACAELGDLLEQIGEKDAALLCYKNGLVDSTQVPVSHLSQDVLAVSTERQAITVPVVENIESNNSSNKASSKDESTEAKP